MGNYPNAVQMTGTVTISASGTGEIVPAKSNSPFQDLSVTVLPEDDSSEYSVVLYQDGEVLDSHTYTSTSDRVVAHMTFPGMIFPANIGTNAIPAFYNADKSNYLGLPLTLVITNLADTQRSFFVYSAFAQWDAPVFAKLTQS